MRSPPPHRHGRECRNRAGSSDADRRPDEPKIVAIGCDGQHIYVGDIIYYLYTSAYDRSGPINEKQYTVVTRISKEEGSYARIWGRGWFVDVTEAAEPHPTLEESCMTSDRCYLYKQRKSDNQEAIRILTEVLSK